MSELYDRKLFEFPVLWSGWETDNKGWIAEKDGKRVVILTSHGREYVAKEAELAKRIEAYREALAGTRQAVRMLHGHDEPESEPAASPSPERETGGLEPWQALYALENMQNYLRSPNEHPYPGASPEIIQTFVRQRAREGERVEIPRG